MSKKRVVVGICGATGTQIGVKVLEVLSDLGIESHTIVSRWGVQTLTQETGLSLDDIRKKSFIVYSSTDMGAAISSGSFNVDSMIIAPCSMRSLAAIATGLGDNLIHRTADVMLKERRKLIIVPRETPLSEIHLSHMLQLSRMGVTIMPPNPAYYNHPSSLDDIVNQFVARLLDQINIEVPFAQRWHGMHKTSANIVKMEKVEE